MPAKRKNPHAVALGKRKSPAKAEASRANGAKGGRPVQTITLAGYVVHHEVELLSARTADGLPIYTAGDIQGTAAQWMRRHGFRLGRWPLEGVVQSGRYGGTVNGWIPPG